MNAQLYMGITATTWVSSKPNPTLFLNSFSDLENSGYTKESMMVQFIFSNKKQAPGLSFWAEHAEVTPTGQQQPPDRLPNGALPRQSYIRVTHLNNLDDTWVSTGRWLRRHFLTCHLFCLSRQQHFFNIRTILVHFKCLTPTLEFFPQAPGADRFSKHSIWILPPFYLCRALGPLHFKKLNVFSSLIIFNWHILETTSLYYCRKLK